MAGLALLLLLGGRSETIRMARGDGADERWSFIDLRATALAGNVVIAAIIAMWLWEIANGRDGSPYGQLGAVAGIAYILGLVFTATTRVARPTESNRVVPGDACVARPT
jgi:hypothetical protein